MTHITLLGDSIFDNESYVGASGKDVISHLHEKLQDHSQATLKAVDGSVVGNVSWQFLESPQNTTHFFISAGGNDALMNTDVLNLKVRSSAELFDNLANRISTFDNHYSRMLEKVLEKKLPTTVCTIYYPNIPDESTQKITVTALSSFNDIIIKRAILAGIPIIDLRLVCSEDGDYANEIEPSDKGGKKIAHKIYEVLEEHNFSSKRTTIYY